MAKSHAPLSGPLIVSLLAIAFCVWTALGNDVNICVTTGCTLYADFSLAGISLWWYGTAAFTILAVCALLGQAGAGRVLAGLMLAGDVCLLLLMALTAPCINCLLVALLFALCYFFFRRKVLAVQRKGQQPEARFPSILLWVWLALFVINLGQVARSQMDIWAIMDESGEPVTRMFFSPSCRYCVEGINALSGNIKVAFYPVAENDADVARIENMLKLIDDGESIAAALSQSVDSEFDGFWSAWKPATLLLRFRLLCNKAHLFSQGSQGVPFFEHKGLMPGLLVNSPSSASQAPAISTAPVAPASDSLSGVASGGDASLPLELQEGLQCGGSIPCPPGQTNSN